MTLDEALRRPGFWVAWTGVWGCPFEVAADLTVYQLNQRNVRDGVLRRDRWNESAITLVEPLNMGPPGG